MLFSVHIPKHSSVGDSADVISELQWIPCCYWLAFLFSSPWYGCSISCVLSWLNYLNIFFPSMIINGLDWYILQEDEGEERVRTVVSRFNWYWIVHLCLIAREFSFSAFPNCAVEHTLVFFRGLFWGCISAVILWIYISVWFMKRFLFRFGF